MPDPARLTDQQIADTEGWANSLRNLHGMETAADRVDALLADLRAERARLAAAENVVEAARGVAVLELDPRLTDQQNAVLRERAITLRQALAAYDAQKEPTGNHAESSTTRGDTHE